MNDSELLARLVSERPAVRSGAELSRIDPARLSAAERVELLTVLEEQRRWLEAAQTRVMAVMQQEDTSELDLVQEEVSLALQVPLRTAQFRLAQASTLVSELPRTLAAVSAGTISGAHAAVLAEAVWRMPTGDTGLPAALEQAVLPSLAGRCVTVPQLRRRVRRAALALDPATAEVRHQRALADRRVAYCPAEDGMASLTALLPAPEAQLLYTRLTAAAGLLPSQDPRSLDQQRADLLVDAVLTGLPHDQLPQVQGRRPAIHVMVNADTLLGLNDEPGHLTGYGPITARTARRLAADQSGTWRRLLTDPDSGALLDISPDRYRPGQLVRDYLSARDDTCAFPTCQQPGYRCEPDHTVPFGAGGRTRRDNLALTCRRHNRAKAGTGWHYRHEPDGSFTWTTTTGHHYTGGARRSAATTDPTARSAESALPTSRTGPGTETGSGPAEPERRGAGPTEAGQPGSGPTEAGRARSGPTEAGRPGSGPTETSQRTDADPPPF
ncbi:MAG TPA: DUF222 domain-containing protein [Jatrophihabitans sp.]|nr:DUF222 domain-containing protein [Jatrophihabitans sp.]